MLLLSHLAFLLRLQVILIVVFVIGPGGVCRALKTKAAGFHTPPYNLRARGDPRKGYCMAGAVSAFGRASARASAKRITTSSSAISP